VESRVRRNADVRLEGAGRGNGPTETVDTAPGSYQEQLNKEIRRHTEVVGIFPSRDALIRLVGPALPEQSDEWTEGRRHMGLELLAKTCIRIVSTEPDPTTTEPAGTTEALTA